MQELIKVSQNHKGTNIVDARELYLFLEIKTDFKDWMPRMLEYGFEEGKDFSPFLSESKGGRPSKEFALTIDCAKEISMIQRSEKGKQARQYFLECEKKLKNPIANITRLDMAKMLVESETENEQLKIQLQADAPKVLFANSVSASSTCILIGEMAKILKQNGINTGEKRLFEWMRNNGYLISRFGTDHNMPTQRSMDLGLFEIKETAINRSSGDITVSKTPKVTGKGQVYFLNKFLKEQKAA